MILRRNLRGLYNGTDQKKKNHTFIKLQFRNRLKQEGETANSPFPLRLFLQLLQYGKRFPSRKSSHLQGINGIFRFQFFLHTQKHLRNRKKLRLLVNRKYRIRITQNQLYRKRKRLIIRRSHLEISVRSFYQRNPVKNTGSSDSYLKPTG